MVPRHNKSKYATVEKPFKENHASVNEILNEKVYLLSINKI